jgi:hypothetical protein
MTVKHMEEESCALHGGQKAKSETGRGQGVRCTKELPLIT